MRITIALALIAGIALLPPLSHSAEENASDAGMFLLNFDKPFVSRNFAEQLGRLIMSEKFKQAVLVPGDPEIQDNNNTWSVTLRLPNGRSPVASDQWPRHR
jgi:hypothetical protein